MKMLTILTALVAATLPTSAIGSSQCADANYSLLPRRVSTTAPRGVRLFDDLVASFAIAPRSIDLVGSVWLRVGEEEVYAIHPTFRECRISDSGFSTWPTFSLTTEFLSSGGIAIRYMDQNESGGVGLAGGYYAIADSADEMNQAGAPIVLNRADYPDGGIVFAETGENGVDESSVVSFCRLIRGYGEVLKPINGLSKTTRQRAMTSEGMVCTQMVDFAMSVTKELYIRIR